MGWHITVLRGVAHNGPSSLLFFGARAMHFHEQSSSCSPGCRCRGLHEIDWLFSVSWIEKVVQNVGSWIFEEMLDHRPVAPLRSDESKRIQAEEAQTRALASKMAEFFDVMDTDTAIKKAEDQTEEDAQ